MPETITLNLGHTDLIGRDAVTQCNFFKMFMRSGIGYDPDGAWLKMIQDGVRIGMAVEYAPEVPGAYEWAKKAENYAELIWQQAQGSKKPNEQIMARR